MVGERCLDIRPRQLGRRHIRGRQVEVPHHILAGGSNDQPKRAKDGDRVCQPT
jgi:hypothetical protein